MARPGKLLSAHRTSNLLIGCAVVLIPWIVVLAVTMKSGDYVVQRWDVAWVGLDLAEVIGLAAVGLLIRRQDVRASPVAAATGTLLLVDAWFDTVTSRTGIDYLRSLCFAWLAEIPLALVCAVVAWRSIQWVADGRAAAKDSRSPASNAQQGNSVDF